MRHNYGVLIKEEAQELEKLEAKHRNSVIGTRMRMLRLLKSGQVKSMQKAADEIHYSLRHVQRWLKVYQEAGLQGLLEPLKPATGGQGERMTEEAWQGLKTAMERGEIASYGQARVLLAEYGVMYNHDTSILKLFRRHGIKAKTGRPRHEQADVVTQKQFKKTLQTS